MAFDSEAPVIGICRNRGFDVGDNIPGLRVSGLLRRGARVVLLGGNQDVRHIAGTNEVDGLIYEVKAGGRGEVPKRIEPAMGRVALSAALNTNRRYDTGTIPALNAPGTRDAANKRHIYTGPLSPISPETVVLRGGTDIRGLVERFTVEDLVVKPADGIRGRGVDFVRARDAEAEVGRRWAADPTLDLIVQERIKPFLWDHSITAAYTAENRRLHGAKRQELRIFSIDDELIPIARVLDPTDPSNINYAGDAYVALNPHSVPDDAYMLAAGVDAHLRDVSGHGEVAAAIDLQFGVRPSAGPDPQWWLTEANIIDPQFPSETQYPDLAYRLNDLRSNQLLRLAGVQ